MAAKKSDSFFIRAQNTVTGAFVESTIDLGSFVDALGQSVLRIHNIQVQWADVDPLLNLEPAQDNTAFAIWQLTTQTQATMVTAFDKAVVSSGSLYMGGSDTTDSAFFMNESADVNLSEWRNGYLIATESLYLGTFRNGDWASGDMTCTLVLECTVEKLSKEAALALALSQQ